MNSPYWKKMETQPTFKDWKEFWDGCVMCACDHGCNQWIMEQTARASLLFRTLANPKATAKIDKITQMPLERINKIWYRIHSWESEKFNRELREAEKKK